jgi:uncharacterized membrane protein
MNREGLAKGLITAGGAVVGFMGWFIFVTTTLGVFILTLDKAPMITTDDTPMVISVLVCSVFVFFWITVAATETIGNAVLPLFRMDVDPLAIMDE